MASTRDKLIISGNVYEHLQFPAPIFYKSASEAEAEKVHLDELRQWQRSLMHGLQGNLFKKHKKILPFKVKTEDERIRGAMREISKKRARTRLKRIINSNAGFWIKRNKKPFPVMFVTLTFKENVTDLKTANYEFTKWVKRLSWEMYKTRFNQLKYVAVPEIQKERDLKTGSAVWHFHVLFFNMPWHIEAVKVIERTWGQGFVFAKTVFNPMQAGAYLAKYVAKDFEDIDLFMKAYYCSRGLFRPIIEYCSEKVREIEKLFKDFKKVSDCYFDTPMQKQVRYCLFLRGAL